jgi:hypothetical protein
VRFAPSLTALRIAVAPGPRIAALATLVRLRTVVLRGPIYVPDLPPSVTALTCGPLRSPHAHLEVARLHAALPALAELDLADTAAVFAAGAIDAMPPLRWAGAPAPVAEHERVSAAGGGWWAVAEVPPLYALRVLRLLVVASAADLRKLQALLPALRTLGIGKV